MKRIEQVAFRCAWRALQDALDGDGAESIDTTAIGPSGFDYHALHHAVGEPSRGQKAHFRHSYRLTIRSALDKIGGRS